MKVQIHEMMVLFGVAWLVVAQLMQISPEEKKIETVHSFCTVVVEMPATDVDGSSHIIETAIRVDCRDREKLEELDQWARDSWHYLNELNCKE